MLDRSGVEPFETSCTLKGRLCSRARDRNVRMLRVSASSVAIQKESATLKNLDLRWQPHYRRRESGTRSSEAGVLTDLMFSLVCVSLSVCVGASLVVVKRHDHDVTTGARLDIDKTSHLLNICTGFSGGLKMFPRGFFHVSMFFQQLVFGELFLFEMSSVSTSSCHSSHAERFTTQAADKNEDLLNCNLGIHVAVRRAPKIQCVPHRLLPHDAHE